jgi:hypothetical protein
MKLIRVFSAVVLVTLMFFVPFGSAATSPGIPATLSYSGTLSDSNGIPITGLKTLTFSLYGVSVGGTADWTEDQPNVYITNGHFATVLGGTTRLELSKFSGNTWLGIKVSGDANELTPRQKLTSVPYAFNGVPSGGIIMWSGLATEIPDGWVLCDGNTANAVTVNGRSVVPPDLRDRFVMGLRTDPNPDIPANRTGGDKEHFHKGYGNEGNLRAAIGAINGDIRTLGYIPLAAGNPNSTEVQRATGYIIGTAGSTFFDGTFNHYTPVYGYTSVGFKGTPTDKATTATKDSLPPYYALAYIMKK